MIDPLEKIEEKISMLHNEHSERLNRVETLLTNLMKHFNDNEVTSSHSDVKETRKRALTMEAALSVKAPSVKAKSSISE